MGMDAFEWVKVVSAVLAGNLLTLWWAYSAYRVTQNERAGIEPSRGPMIYLVGLIIPPLVVAAGGYLLKVSG